MTEEKPIDSSEVSIIILTKEIMLENYDRIKELLDLVPGRKWSRKEIMADRPMKWDYSLLAMDKDKIIGLRLISKKGNTRHHHMTSIDKLYRRSGVGSKMTYNSALMAIEMGESTMTVKVEDGNDMSLNFHLKFGFKVYGEEFNEEEGVKYILLQGKPEIILDKLDSNR